MTDAHELDCEPMARPAYDAFLVALPNVAIHGLLRCDRSYYIVAPSLHDTLPSGITIKSWFDDELSPAGAPIHLVGARPADGVEIRGRSRVELVDNFGTAMASDGLFRHLC